MKKLNVSQIGLYAGLSFFACMCLYPFLLIVGGSFTGEQEIRSEGFKIIPKNFSTKAYELLFAEPKFILHAYAVSITVTVIGTIVGVMITAMLAYPLSVRSYRYRKAISFYIIFTLMFNGGMISWYIITANYLHLRDNLLALIVPILISPFNVILVRNYFESIPGEIYESAKIDGAGELSIFYKIIFPLSTPVLAIVALFIALGYWNDWWLGIMLIDKQELKPLQLLLRSVVTSVDFLKSFKSAALLDQSKLIPSESIKLATSLVTIAPIILAYPLLQKYFIKGITIGAVKG